MFTILTGLLGIGQGLTDLESLIQSSKKWRNINDVDLLKAMISVLPEDWFANLDTGSLQSSFSRLESLGLQEIKAIWFVLWCSFWEAYTGVLPGLCENLQGEGAPNV